VSASDGLKFKPGSFRPISKLRSPVSRRHPELAKDPAWERYAHWFDTCRDTREILRKLRMTAVQGMF